jgi:hypothetical protein
VDRDTINAFDFAEDLVRFKAVTAIDGALSTGGLSNGSFNADLAAAVGAGQLGASHAVLFRPTTLPDIKPAPTWSSSSTGR